MEITIVLISHGNGSYLKDVTLRQTFFSFLLIPYNYMKSVRLNFFILRITILQSGNGQRYQALKLHAKATTRHFLVTI